MTTTVIVSAWRRPDLVPHVLGRLARQLVRPDQVIYAEDDINEPMAEAIRTAAARFRLPVLHLRQPNHGARKTVANNRAIRHATGERLLFLDQDCLPGRFWIASHRLLARPGGFTQGWRIHVRQPAVPRFLAARFPLPGALLRRDLYPLRRLVPHRQHIPSVPEGFEVLGCNFGVARADFLAVGGYDETFVGWGYEDVDLAIRLVNSGLRYHVAAGPISVFHLDHPVQSRVAATTRLALCNQRRASGTTRAELGIDRPAGTSSIQKLDATCTRLDFAS